MPDGSVFPTNEAAISASTIDKIGPYTLARHISVMDRRHDAADDAWLAAKDPKDSARLSKIADRISRSLEPLYQAGLSAEPHDLRDVTALMVLVSAGLCGLQTISCVEDAQETAGKLLNAVLLSLPIMSEHIGVSLQDIGGTYCLPGGGIGA